MRRRRLKDLWRTLKELRARRRLTRDELLMTLGAARKGPGRPGGWCWFKDPGPRKC